MTAGSDAKTSASTAYAAAANEARSIVKQRRVESQLVRRAVRRHNVNRCAAANHRITAAVK